MSYASKQLNDIFNQASVITVEYDSNWENGTGYFDGAVKAEFPELKSGDRWKTTDPNGRKIVGVKTPFGNVVVFERYSNGDIITNNTPRECSGVVRSGSMSEGEILSALGYFEFDTNIGKLLQLAVDLGRKQAQA